MQRPREKTSEEIFSTLIEELYPNRNYCVSVMVTASLNKHSIPSAWKCVTASPIAQQGNCAVAREWIVWPDCVQVFSFDVGRFTSQLILKIIREKVPLE